MKDQDKIVNSVQFADILTFNGKNYIEITNKDLPNVMPKKFYISVDGEVYNATTHRFSRGTLTPRGYVYMEFMDTEGKRICTFQHVILEHVFNWFEGCTSLEVNHKNGIRNDNRLSNLEMVTHKENMDHAYRTGLNQNYCENSVAATITNDTAREICKVLASGDKRTYAEIAEDFGVSEMMIVQIATGATWQRIAKEAGYVPKKRNSRFTDEDVKNICKIFVQYKHLGFDEVVHIVANKIGFNYDHNFRNKIKNIYYKNNGYFTRISNKYDYLS